MPHGSRSIALGICVSEHELRPTTNDESNGLEPNCKKQGTLTRIRLGSLGHFLGSKDSYLCVETLREELGIFLETRINSGAHKIDTTTLLRTPSANFYQIVRLAICRASCDLVYSRQLEHLLVAICRPSAEEAQRKSGRSG